MNLGTGVCLPHVLLHLTLHHASAPIDSGIAISLKVVSLDVSVGAVGLLPHRQGVAGGIKGNLVFQDG